jgi:hypothetical protein
VNTELAQGIWIPHEEKYVLTIPQMQLDVEERG